MTKPRGKPTLPETTAEALLNMARQYHVAADMLFPVRKDIMSPLYFLYTHTIELALKAYLRSCGCSVPKKHPLQPLIEKCQSQGLQVNGDLANIIRLLESENEVQGFRYFAPISTLVPEIGYLREVVDDLMGTVTEKVRKKSSEGLEKRVVIKITAHKPTMKRQSRKAT